MKTKYLFVFFTFLFTLPILAQNSIDFVSAPMNLTAGETVDVTVSYSIADPNAYVLVRLVNPNGENPQAFTTHSGSGTHTFSITVPNSPSGGYRWQAQLLNTNNWGGLDNEFIDGVTVSGSEPPTGSNDISFVNAPTSLTAGETVDVTVSYSIAEPNAYVLVRLVNPNGENPQAFTTHSGSGTHTFTITVPNSPSGGYRWQAQLLNTINWGGLDNEFIDGVTVSDSQPPLDDSISLIAVPNEVAQGESYDIGFNYNFAGERWVQAFITNRTLDANGDWVKIAQGLQLFEPGIRNDAISIQIIGEPLDANLLVIQAFQVTQVDGVDVWDLVAEDMVDNIGFTDGFGFGERDTTPNGDEAYMRYYDRSLEGNGSTYNGNDVGNGSGVDHTLAPTSEVYRSNWWVNANWRGPIKSHYGENDTNGEDFWVEWQNLGQGPGGHAEFDIRVEKSDLSDGGALVGFPSRIDDITGSLDASFTGRWTAGSTGRGHINMTTWLHGFDPNGNEIRSDIIIHAWDNSGDIKSNYERSYEWSPDNSNLIFYFDRIGTASDGNISYDVLRTIPGGFGESASYNLIPVDWRRNHIDEFPTSTITSNIDVAEIIREVIRLEEENGSESRREQNSTTDIPVYTVSGDWDLRVMEWTITGQSGAYVHDPSNPDPDVNIYVPNSRGRFTFEQYSIANPCASNPNINCPSTNLRTPVPEVSSFNLNDQFQEFTISPNPFKESISYEYGVEKNEAVTVELYSLDGRKIKTLKKREKHKAGNYSDLIDTSELDAGLYFIRIQTSEGSNVKKLIKN